METTVMLAQILGWYLLIVGVAVLMNPRHIMLAVVALVHERFAQLLVGFIALLVGLIVVTLHNDWSTLPATLVTLLAGWAAIVKGIFYLCAPEKKISKLVHMFTERKWYVIDGAIAILLGLYLLNFVYGWM